MSRFADEAIGTFNYAHSFWGAARALSQLEWKDRETHPDSPAEFLYWHATELFLKAYLLADGVSPSELRGQKFGHNITELASEASKRGLALSPEDLNWLTLMPTQKYMVNLRYLTEGFHDQLTFQKFESSYVNIYGLVGAGLRDRGIEIGFHSEKIPNAPNRPS